MADMPQIYPERMADEQLRFDKEEQEAIETRMIQLFGEDWQAVLETLEVNSVLFVR